MTACPDGRPPAPITNVCSPFKNGVRAAQGRAAEFRGSERAKEFVKLAETLFWPNDGRKSQDGFFDGLLDNAMSRFLTGLLLAGLWFALVLSGPAPLVAATVLLATIGVLIEYSGMTLAAHPPLRRGLVVVAGCLPLATTLTGGATLAAGVTAGILVVIAICMTAGPALDSDQRFALLTSGVLAVAYIGLFAAHLLLLFRLPAGRLWLLFLTCVTAAADTGAYYCGTLIGRHKLCPLVSPGKTVEGLIGGLAAAVATGLAVAHFAKLPTAVALIAAAVAAVCGVAGDLTESVIKRHAGRKDSGRLLPGHGGLFDRVDALIAGTPAVYYAVRYLVHG